MENRIYIKIAVPATNNIAKYEVLILSLELTFEVRARSVKVYNDSQLVVEQVNGWYEARDQSMMKYLVKAK